MPMHTPRVEYSCSLPTPLAQLPDTRTPARRCWPVNEFQTLLRPNARCQSSPCSSTDGDALPLRCGEPSTPPSSSHPPHPHPPTHLAASEPPPHRHHPRHRRAAAHARCGCAASVHAKSDRFVTLNPHVTCPSTVAMTSPSILHLLIVVSR